jgi:glyoxylase-like metal-dependent hydrolase (beta-lactamase superfamily II)
MSISNVAPHLYDVQLSIPGTDFTSLLSSWVYYNDDLCFLVDPGPRSVINSLKKALQSIGIGKSDLKYVLLTHIHMDHAGGVGELIKSFPQAQVICHPRGIKHLINPDKLWEGSLKVLGEVAKIYGKITPVPEDRIGFQESVANGRIKVFETLGHAPHHQSYLFDPYLFAGEAAGVNISLNDTFFTRPATPPVFDYVISIASIRKLLAENLPAFKICYGHFGIKDNAEFFLKLAEEQLTTWVEVISELLDKRDTPNFFGLVIEELKQKDKNFSGMDLMDKETEKKELFFTGNCIKGIADYLQKKNTEIK